MPDFELLQHFPDCTCVKCISHPAHARPGIHAFPEKLYVVAVLDNPLRWRSRYTNYWEFQRHVESAGGILITVELAFGHRHFELTERGNPHHVQVRSQGELFRKENLQNLGAQRLPLGSKYVAFIDADMIFVRPDWCQETLHLLQHYDVIQMFSAYSDVGPNQEILRTVPSFMYNFFNEPDRPGVPDSYSGYGNGWPRGKWNGAPGGGWAYRVDALDQLGDLLDRCILGGGDSHMAFGLVQAHEIAKEHLEIIHAGSPEYVRYIQLWQQNAARLKGNIGLMDGSLLHKFHGPKRKRGYGARYQILENNKFDPYADVMVYHKGVLELTGNKPALRDGIRQYFRSRDEDSTNL